MFGKFPTYIIFVYIIVITMRINGIEAYQSPQIVIIEARYEGVVCSSNEDMDEIEGEW